MKILYSLPHPSDRLGAQRAGHMIRATAMLSALQNLGHEVIRVEAASSAGTQLSVSVYRKLIRNLLPRPIAMRMRDRARIQHGIRYASHLIERAQQNKPDLILETHIAFSLAGKIASEQTGLPLILDDCTPAWEEEQQYGVGLKNEVKRIHREVTAQASLLIAVNKTMRRNLLEEGAPPETVITVENGFDDKAFYPGVDGSHFRKQFQIPDDSVVIVFVGSFQPYHRVDLLLRSFQLLRGAAKVHLLIVGEGRTLQDCKELAKTLGLTSRVTFVGRVPYAEVPSYAAAGDIAVMPATNAYGNPMKIYEYMALGKAIIAPLQPTITEIATHGEDAYLFKAEDISSLASAINTLVSDPDLVLRLGRCGAKRASEHSWDKRAQVLQDAMQSVLRNNRPAPGSKRG